MYGILDIRRVVDGPMIPPVHSFPLVVCAVHLLHSIRLNFVLLAGLSFLLNYNWVISVRSLSILVSLPAHTDHTDRNLITTGKRKLQVLVPSEQRPTWTLTLYYQHVQVRGHICLLLLQRVAALIENSPLEDYGL